MDGEVPEDMPNEAIDPADRSLIEDLRLLAGDAKSLAQAEIAYQKSRAGVIGGGLGKIAGLGALALLLVWLALVALVVGLLFALVPLLTAWGATAVVTVGLLILAGIIALWARSSWRKISLLISDEEPRT
jgi:uncharacterized membrane protein YqjE